MEAIKRMNYQTRILTQLIGREPKPIELAKVMGISEAKVIQLQNYIHREPISIDNLNQEKFTDESDE